MNIQARGDEIDFTAVRVRAGRGADGRRALTVLTTCPRSGDALGAETCARCPHDRGLSFDPVDALWYRLCWRDLRPRPPSPRPC